MKVIDIIFCDVYKGEKNESRIFSFSLKKTTNKKIKPKPKIQAKTLLFTKPVQPTFCVLSGTEVNTFHLKQKLKIPVLSINFIFLLHFIANDLPDIMQFTYVDLINSLYKASFIQAR